MARAARITLASLALTLLLAACSGQTTTSSTPTPTTVTSAVPTASTATPTVLVRSTPEASRAMAHLRMLAGTIGNRPLTLEGERKAAEYIRAQLEQAGYRATIEPFVVDVATGGSAKLIPDGAPEVEAQPMSGSPDRSANGPLIAAGLGRSGEYGSTSARGAVVLVDRGETQFAEKARVAQDAGAVGLIVVNNQAGAFRGDLGSALISIPVISAANEDRAVLQSYAASGRRVTVSTKTERLQGTSQNVVGKPSDAPCTAYLGAHYDSVTAGPGANDNGSGTSLLLELARARHLDGVCVIAFGSEEVGLLGSRAYVKAHNEVPNARFMLNFDMVAKITRPALIGDADLATRASKLPEASGLNLRQVTSLGPGASSDYATFLQAGVPALMLYSGDDQFIHTAQDDVANTSEADMGRFLTLAAAVLDMLTAR
ncbi:MAG: hypothetical protein DWI48_05070 [Chloroflexi bacterium]|nr:MAG: hypothetical protein DWI48_05070 [Chloroflexota bacterium]